MLKYEPCIKYKELHNKEQKDTQIYFIFKTM